jgi:hypothetical protein
LNPVQSSDYGFAAQLRGFGPLGILFILLIVFSGNIMLSNMIVLPIGAALVFLWIQLSHTRWCEIGYTKPKNWLTTVCVGLLFGIVFKFVMKAIIMPLFGADPINASYHFLAGNQPLLPAAIWAMIAAGFGEETVFRGYMFERLGKLFGSAIGAKTLIILITSVWFGFAHYHDQGLTGVEQGTITGLVFGIIYLNSGSIWLVMIVHAAFDLTALAMIYWNFEATVAHFIFK